MRFIIDNNLPEAFARRLNEAGHDAVHVQAVGIQHATDEVIFDHAQADGRIIVSQDADFGVILANRLASAPSLVLFRCSTRTGVALAELLLANFRSIESDLAAGAVVVIDDSMVRIRRLPLR